MGWLLNYNEGNKRRSQAAQRQKNHIGTTYCMCYYLLESMHLRHSGEMISRRHEVFYTQTPGLEVSGCDSTWRPPGLVHRNPLYRFFSCQMWAIPAFSLGLRSIHQVIRVVGLCLALPNTTRPVITWWGIHTACVSCLQHQQRERKQQVAGSPCGWLEFRNNCYDVEIVYIVIGYWHWTLDSQFIAKVAYHFRD